jgi:hypothetical protein
VFSCSWTVDCTGTPHEAFTFIGSDISRGLAAVPRYVAKFTKNVLSGTGHQVTITQRTFDVQARNAEAAIQLAKMRFCDLEGIKDCSSHSDKLIVEEADVPS